jgi:hypothetical protein
MKQIIITWVILHSIPVWKGWVSKPKAKKTKSGSQSRKKNYHWHNESKLNGQ